MVRRERERTLRVRKRRKVAPLTAEELDWLATLAADAGNLGLAIRLVEMALRQVPAQADLHIDLGLYRSQAGDLGGALAAYAEAARRSDDGRAEFEAAILCAGPSNEMAGAASLLSQALEKDASLVDEVHEVAWPPGFLQREDVREALARAQRDASNQRDQV